MDIHEQSTHFQNELVSVIERFRKEYDLSLAQAIGVIESVKLDLFLQEREAQQDQD